jgi:PAS domain S-box-containing protein
MRSERRQPGMSATASVTSANASVVLVHGAARSSTSNVGYAAQSDPKTFPRERFSLYQPSRTGDATVAARAAASDGGIVVSLSTEHHSEALLAAAHDAVLVVDDARIFVDANPAACRLLGLSVAELRGRRFDDFLAPTPDLEGAWRAFLRSGEHRGELEVVRANGERRHVEYSATARFMAGRHLAILRDIADRKRAEDERVELLHREQLRLRETETLLAVSRALSSTLDPTETMRRVSREIALALGADMVGAYLADATRTRLSPVAGYRVPRDMLDDFRRIPIPMKNHPAIEEAWTHRRAVWTDDMPGDRRVDPEILRQFPHQSDLFVPIRIKDQPVGGFFVIWWTARRSFTDWEVRLMQGISDLAGIFLENAQLYRQTSEDSRAKDEFLATLSHELRNPLGAIANAAAALDRRAAGEEAAARLRQIIHRQTRHLTRLVDDLLDVARAAAGKIALHMQPLDLSEVAASCVGSLRASGRAEALRVSFRAQSVTVNVDATRLAQIITNMLDNAVKFTPPGGAIDVDVVREGQKAVLRVRDTGAGIEPEMLPRIFELFAQAQQPMDRSVGGLGIGLTLSRRLVEMHEGTITAASDGPGRGAEFTVRLPVATAVTPEPSPTLRGPERSRSILVVEDNDDARESLRLLLESLGHRVFAAGDGPEGLALADRYRPELALIDLGLPGLDGYEVARALRASPTSKTMTLIAVTGYGQAEDRQRSKEAGFDAHLVKPVSQTLLSSLIAAP